MYDPNDDDPDLSDQAWHKSYIYANSYATTGPTHSIKLENGRLIFKQGNFAASALKRIVKPTMKGFWVPISVMHGAELRLVRPVFDELIGLQNCAEHVGGKIVIASKRLRTFELIPITYINELDIRDCENLLQLEHMPAVLTSLTLNYEQVKHNLKFIFNACSPRCTVRLPSDSDKQLEHIINCGLMRKGSPSMNERQALLQLQTDLIDHDLDEYSNI